MRALFEDKEFRSGESQAGFFSVVGVGVQSVTDARDLVDYFIRITKPTGTAYTVLVYSTYEAAAAGAADTEIGSYSGDITSDGVSSFGPSYSVTGVELTITNEATDPSVAGLTITVDFDTQSTDEVDLVWSYTCSPDIRAHAYIVRSIRERATDGRTFSGLHASAANTGRPGDEFQDFEIFAQTDDVEIAGGTGSRPVHNYLVSLSLIYHIGKDIPADGSVMAYAWVRAQQYLNQLASLFWDELKTLNGILCSSGGEGGGALIPGSIEPPDDSPYDNDYALLGRVTFVAPIPHRREF